MPGSLTRCYRSTDRPPHVPHVHTAELWREARSTVYRHTLAQN